MNANHCEDCQERLPSLLEGFLDEEDARLVRAHLEACDECRREYTWLSEAVRDLEHLGDDIVRNAPQIDLVEAVLRGAEEIDSITAPQTLQFRRPRPLRWAVAGVGWAAMAAGIAALVWLGLQWRPERGPDLAGTKTPRTPMPAVVAADRDPGEVREVLKVQREKLDVERRKLRTEERKVSEQILAATDAPEIKDLKTQDILAQRKAAMSNSDAFAQLMEWAKLSPEEARKIVNAKDANELAVIGAADSLDNAEAAAVLTRVVGHYPENPYARFALAKELSQPLDQPVSTPRDGNPEVIADTGSVPGVPTRSGIYTPGMSEEQYQSFLKQLADLRALDPENALTYYMEALARFQRGDLQTGQQLLEQAQQAPRANAYSFLAAQYAEQAQLGRGMNAEAARMLTALTAGSKGAQYLDSLGRDLLDFGRSLLSTGSNQDQTDTARAVLEGVQQFGDQISTSASFSSEDLVGLELQADANQELQSLYEALGYTTALADLSTQMEALTQSMADLRSFFDFFNQLLSGQSVDWGSITDLILNNGDLSLQSLL